MQFKEDDLSPEEVSRFKEIVFQRVNFSPYYNLLGMTIVDIGKGRSRFHLPVGKKLHNIGGIVHGGALASLADAAIGVSLATLVDPTRESFVTVELKVNFLSPIAEGDLWADGKIIKRGNSIAVGEAEVYDGSERIVAKAIATLLIRKRGNDLI
jgi:acyl-CoA thioesterase